MIAGLASELIKHLGGSFARDLGIRLTDAAEAEIQKWFLASFLYGARISTSIAARTYREFEKRGVVAPASIRTVGWDGLVQVLDAGGYVRYDFSTATKLLAVSTALLKSYGGELGNVHAAAANPGDLERRLMAIGKGIGPVTANIFLRELRGIWPKAQPALSDPATMAARCLGLLRDRAQDSPRALMSLQRRWRVGHPPELTFVDFEAALVRLGLGFCRKGQHARCPLAALCPTAREAGRAALT